MAKSFFLALLIIAGNLCVKGQSAISLKIGNQFYRPETALDSLMSDPDFLKDIDPKPYVPYNGFGLSYFTFKLDSNFNFILRKVNPQPPDFIKNLVLYTMKKVNTLWYYDKSPFRKQPNKIPRVLIYVFNYSYIGGKNQLSANLIQDSLQKEEKMIKETREKYKLSGDTVIFRGGLNSIVESKIKPD